MRFDYDEENILAWTLLMVVSMAVGGSVVYWLVYRGFGFWAAAAIVIGVYVLGKWSHKHNWDFWEWLDYVGWWVLVMGTVAFLSWGPDTLWYGVGYLAGVVGVGILAKNYRKIRWYMSGKPGFTGLVALIWIAVVEIGVAFAGGDNKYLIGVSVRQWLAAWLLTASIVVLYLRGKSKI